MKSGTVACEGCLAPCALPPATCFQTRNPPCTAQLCYTYNMINASSGGSVLPREVIQWLDSLDLSYAVRNPKMDLANGFVVAEILTRKHPSELSIFTFYNAQRKDRKMDNWEQITKFLAKKKFKVTREEYESITNLGPEAAQSFLFRLYEFFTGEKLNADRRLASTITPPEEPLYKKPTASTTAKDRQLERVVDNREKETRVKKALDQQKQMITTQKYNSGLIEWLIQRRKQEIQKEVEKHRVEIQKKNKSFSNVEAKVEVREIELKCFNSSTNKKAKGGDYGDLVQSKGVFEFLAQSCTLLFKRDSVIADLKKLGFEFKEKDTSGINLLQELLKRCEEVDSRGNLKVTADTITRLLEQCKKTGQITLVVDNIHNNFVDYKKYFTLFMKPLHLYEKDSEIFRLLISIFTSVAKGLQNHDPQNAEMMFEEILLPGLLKAGENAYKRPAIASLCLEFIRKQSDCCFSFIQSLKEIYRGEIKVFISYLALLLQKMSRDCDELQYNLWSEFFYYGFKALSSPSPTTRVYGARVIALLFSEVVVVSNQMIADKLTSLEALLHDSWWEVRAQALIIFKAILVSRYKNQTGDTDINTNLNTKTILHYIFEIFKPNVSHNILRVGLIELAELLNYEVSLCGRYLEILLHVNTQIRTEVLNTNVIKIGPVVYGANTFSYKLSGAPLIWNSIGIAKVLNEHLKQNHVGSLNQAHLQILYSTISHHNGSFADISQEWLKLYGQLKQKIFDTFEDESLCTLGASIIRQFVQVPGIRDDIINKSRSELARTLSKVYGSQQQEEVKANLLSLFSYLQRQESQFTYRIIKEFSEKEKQKYLESNLVEFMNDLTRERRKRLFPQS